MLKIATGNEKSRQNMRLIWVNVEIGIVYGCRLLVYWAVFQFCV